MEPNHLLRETLYRELQESAHHLDQLLLHYKDISKHDLLAAQISTNTWEVIAKQHDSW